MCKTRTSISCGMIFKTCLALVLVNLWRFLAEVLPEYRKTTERDVHVNHILFSSSLTNRVIELNTAITVRSLVLGRPHTHSFTWTDKTVTEKITVLKSNCEKKTAKFYSILILLRCWYKRREVHKYNTIQYPPTSHTFTLMRFPFWTLNRTYRKSLNNVGNDRTTEILHHESYLIKQR